MRDLTWIQSSRIGSPDWLTSWKSAAQVVRDALDAANPILSVLEGLAQAQSALEAAFQALSAQRTVETVAGQLLEGLVQEYLTDGGYLIQYSNLRSLIDRYGFTPFLREAEENLQNPEDLDLSPIPGVRAEYPPSNELNPLRYLTDASWSKARRAAYSGMDLLEQAPFESFDDWLIPVLEAFYDEGDLQRPDWGVSDKFGGALFVVSGTDPQVVYDTVQRMRRLVTGLGDPLEPLGDALGSLMDLAADPPPLGRMAGDALRRALGITALQPLDIRPELYSTAPNFLRLGTEDLVPGFGRLMNRGAALSAALVTGLPSSIGLDALGAQVAEKLAILEQILEEYVRIIEQLVDILETPGTSRLVIETRQWTRDEFVQAVYEASATRNDPVRVLSNPDELEFDGRTLRRGDLLPFQDARTLAQDFPSFRYGPPGNLVIAGIGLFYTEGPLARLMDETFGPRPEDLAEDAGGPSVLETSEHLRNVEQLRAPLTRGGDPAGGPPHRPLPPPLPIQGKLPSTGPWSRPSGPEDGRRRATPGQDPEAPPSVGPLRTLRSSYGVHCHLEGPSLSQVQPGVARRMLVGGWSVGMGYRPVKVRTTAYNLTGQDTPAGRLPVGTRPPSAEQGLARFHPPAALSPRADAPESVPLGTCSILPGGTRIRSPEAASWATSIRTSSNDTPWLVVQVDKASGVRLYLRVEPVRVEGDEVLVSPALPSAPLVQDTAKVLGIAGECPYWEASLEPDPSIPDAAGFPGFSVGAAFASRKDPSPRASAQLLEEHVNTLQVSAHGHVLDADSLASGRSRVGGWASTDDGDIVAAFATGGGGSLYKSTYPRFDLSLADLTFGEASSPSPAESRAKAVEASAGVTRLSLFTHSVPQSPSLKEVPSLDGGHQALRAAVPVLSMVGLGAVGSGGARVVVPPAGVHSVAVHHAGGTVVLPGDGYTLTEDGEEYVVLPSPETLSAYEGDPWVLLVRLSGDAYTSVRATLLPHLPLDADRRPYFSGDLFLVPNGSPISGGAGVVCRGTSTPLLKVPPSLHEAGEVPSSGLARTERAGSRARTITLLFTGALDSESLPQGAYLLAETVSHRIVVEVQAFSLLFRVYEVALEGDVVTEVLAASTDVRLVEGQEYRLVLSVSPDGAGTSLSLSRLVSVSWVEIVSASSSTASRGLEVAEGGSVRLGEAPSQDALLSADVLDFWTNAQGVYYGGFPMGVTSVSVQMS